MNCRKTRYTDITQENCSSKCSATDPECFSVYTPKETGTSKFYFVKPSNGGVSWEQAESACKNMNMQLASIRTESEQIEARNPLMPTAWHKMRKTATKSMGPIGGVVSMIGSKLEKSDPLVMHWAWIGLSSEDGKDWEWKDPNAPSPQDALSGGKFGWGKEFGIKQSGTKKSAGPGDRRCAALVRGMWNDTPCSNRNDSVSGYLCEHVSTCDVFKCDESDENEISVEGAMFNSYSEFERKGDSFNLSDKQVEQIQNTTFSADSSRNVINNEIDTNEELLQLFQQILSKPASSQQEDENSQANQAQLPSSVPPQPPQQQPQQQFQPQSSQQPQLQSFQPQSQSQFDVEQTLGTISTLVSKLNI